ncbi:hypothetical protein BpHYR1_041832 [Brachionus plicatilis]|uniref:Uncharacterized protein n=1 Tax=Brachionus plicatilis TaxID=10195 RepID=A0A3M7RKL3_BRAPC|nr:hypothetical protein BpHYR1_041832 [Brachionus plicatilis]
MIMCSSQMKNKLISKPKAFSNATEYIQKAVAPKAKAERPAKAKACLRADGRNEVLLLRPLLRRLI